MESIIRNNPFVDGNKRTAITSAGILLRRSGHLLETSQTELFRFSMAMATGKAKFEDALRWLRLHSRPEQLPVP